MTRLNKKMENAGAKNSDGFCISECTSPWNMDLYFAVDKEVSGAENVKFSGKYFCKVYEGDFKNNGSWFKDFAEYVKSKGITPGRMFSWYTTCPNCAKKYGKNYVVIISKIEG